MKQKIDPFSVPRVGVGVMIIRYFEGNPEPHVLLGERLGSHGEGEFSFPGGHLEFGESISGCAVRETTKEECGVVIGNIRFQFFSNVTAYPGRHYAHIGVIADYVSGEAELLEPDKCKSWGWHPLNKLPSPLFLMCDQAITSYYTRQTFFDSSE